MFVSPTTGRPFDEVRPLRELKPLEEFAWRRKARPARQYCRPCRSAYHREHYLANKQRYIDQAQARKDALHLERTRYLLDYFADAPLRRLRRADPLVLEFDHLADKTFDIGSGFLPQLASILDEIAKCEVVCAELPPPTDPALGALRVLLTNPKDERATRLEPASFSLEG